MRGFGAPRVRFWCAAGLCVLAFLLELWESHVGRRAHDSNDADHGLALAHDQTREPLFLGPTSCGEGSHDEATPWDCEPLYECAAIAFDGLSNTSVTVAAAPSSMSVSAGADHKLLVVLSFVQTGVCGLVRIAFYSIVAALGWSFKWLSACKGLQHLLCDITDLVRIGNLNRFMQCCLTFFLLRRSLTRGGWHAVTFLTDVAVLPSILAVAQAAAGNLGNRTASQLLLTVINRAISILHKWRGLRQLLIGETSRDLFVSIVVYSCFWLITETDKFVWLIDFMLQRLDSGFGGAFDVIVAFSGFVAPIASSVGRVFGGLCERLGEQYSAARSSAKALRGETEQANAYASAVALLNTEAREKEEKQQQKIRRAIQALKKVDADAEAEARYRQEAESKAAGEEKARKAKKERVVKAKREAEIALRQAKKDAYAATVLKSRPSLKEPDAAATKGASDDGGESRPKCGGVPTDGRPTMTAASRQPIADFFATFECPIR